MPEISIIVPVYKVEKYLDRCVQSILEQTFTDFELILVDDGSPDNCPKMCDQWASRDERIRVIHKENGGLSSARNAGLDIASGRYIGFVDSDDWIFPYMYEVLFSLIKKNDYDISICGITRAVGDRVSINYQQDLECIYTQEEYLKKILKVNTQDSNHYAWNKLYKYEVMKNVRYPEGLIDEDVEGTFLAVLNANKIIEVKRICYVYWINPNSITTSLFNEKQLDYLTICDRIVSVAKERCDSDIVEHAIKFRYRADFGLLCKLAISDISIDFDKKECKRKLLRSLRSHYWILLKDTIPLSRKLMMSVMCINYTVGEILLKVIYRLFKNTIKLSV